MKYAQEQTERILAAYRRLFPEPISAEMTSFLDLARSRPWSYLTSDFHGLNYKDLQDFDREYERQDFSQESCGEKRANLLRQFSKDHGIGFSMGISPWTDAMLLETFSSDTDEVIIVVAHDWWPIVSSDLQYHTESPLTHDSPLCETVYAKAFPRSLIRKTKRAILFLNLCPDFRKPGAAKTGQTEAAKFVPDLLSCCAGVAKNFRLGAIISWGSPVWEGFAPRSISSSPAASSLGIKKASLLEDLKIPVGGQTVRYFPFAHPGNSSFHDRDHRKAFDSICSSL